MFLRRQAEIYVMRHQLPSGVVGRFDRVPASGKEEHGPGESGLGQDDAALGLDLRFGAYRHDGLGQGGSIVVDQTRIELRSVAEIGELAVQHPLTVAEAPHAWPFES